MDKETFFTEKMQKSNIKKEELVELWDKYAKDAKDFGVAEADTDKYCIYRINQHLLKIEREPFVEVAFVPVTAEVTDYGAQKSYFDSKEKFKTNAELAVRDGLTDVNGIPLYQKGFKKGQPINLEDAETKTFFGKAKDNKSGKEVLATFSIKGSLIDKYKLSLGDIYKVKATQGQKSTAIHLELYAREDGEVTLLKKQSYEEKAQLVVDLYKENMCNIKDLGAYFEQRKDKPPVFVAIKGNVLSMRITNNSVQGGVEVKKNNILELMDASTGSDYVTCWVSDIDEFGLNFREDTMDVIIVGTVGKTGNDQKGYQMQISRVAAIFVKDEYRKKDTQKVDDTKEVTHDDDVTNFIKG